MGISPMEDQSTYSSSLLIDPALHNPFLALDYLAEQLTMPECWAKYLIPHTR